MLRSSPKRSPQTLQNRGLGRSWEPKCIQDALQTSQKTAKSVQEVSPLRGGAEDLKSVPGCPALLFFIFCPSYFYINFFSILDFILEGSWVKKSVFNDPFCSYCFSFLFVSIFGRFLVILKPFEPFCAPVEAKHQFSQNRHFRF